MNVYNMLFKEEQQKNPELIRLNFYEKIMARENSEPLKEYQIKEVMYLFKKYKGYKITRNGVLKMCADMRAGGY